MKIELLTRFKEVKLSETQVAFYFFLSRLGLITIYFAPLPLTTVITLIPTPYPAGTGPVWRRCWRHCVGRWSTLWVGCCNRDKQTCKIYQWMMKKITTKLTITVCPTCHWVGPRWYCVAWCAVSPSLEERPPVESPASHRL